ncbi:MAG: TRAP transporter substrate-binding protein [Sphaerochaetaceae bacterium]|nr:TRAP transporter substrate-binding protein [Sphaerochaetaceae bacterium]
MKTKATVVLVMVLLLAGAMAFAAGQVESAKPIIIRYAGTAAASMDNPEYLAMLRFKEVVEEKSEGKIVVEVYPANQLGATKEFTEGVAVGSIEMGVAGYDLIGLFDHMAYVFTLPYLHDSLEHYIKVIEGPIGEEVHNHLIETAGIRVIGVLNRGPRHMMNTKRPVNVPTDLKGLKIRSPENPLNAGTVNAMGASAVPVSWGEVYTAISQGVVDGVENAIDELYSQKLHEVNKYLSLTQHIYLGIPIMINEDFYQSLSAENRKILEEAAQNSVQYRRELLKDSENIALEAMKKAGVQVNESPDIAAFAATANVVWEQFVDGKNITWDLIERIKNY